MVVEVAPLRGAEVTVTTADVLHRAADVIEEWGWAQGTHARRTDGSPCGWDSVTAASFCALGAIHKALDDLGLVGEDRNFVRCAGWLAGCVPDFNIKDWNDDLGRTQAEVVATLRAAAGGAT